MKKTIRSLLSLVLALSLACGMGTVAYAQGTSTTYQAGTYEGKGTGRGGALTVEVVLSASAIESVTVKAHQETLGISDLALLRIPADIVTHQSLGVDTVAGATLTSFGVINAAADALQAAGADVSALRKVAVIKDLAPVEDMATQVVVAGGGIAGLMAAATAADNGASVILVEKLPFLGGSLIVAGGGHITVDSTFFDNGEADDSLARVMTYIRLVNETSARQPDYAFVEKLLSQTGKTIDYVADSFGLARTYTDRGDYIRSYFGDGNALVQSLTQVLADKGVTVLLGTSAQEVLVADNAAVGLQVASEAGEFAIRADKVILATGGASWNKERLLAANPELSTVALSEQAIAGNTGDGFRMLEDIGAQMGEGPFVKSAYPDFSYAFHFTWRNNPSVANVLVVDAAGNRFANESPYNAMVLNKNMLRHGSPAYYALFDTVNTDETFLGLMKEKAVDDNARVVVYAETIEALAEKLKVDPATLRKTYDRYQALCASGTDTDYGKDASRLIPYANEGGYYAAYLMAASWGTIGGAITDEQFHVLRTDGSVIDNLFAAGEVATSTLFGDYYFGGFSLGYYSTAARIAAETAVSEINAAQ